ncbi:MAG TPA: dienelactone hydrolase family protein [Stellaceae bacterium]|nr:dienelactone hydrolase family protein [Stellaceae bacterium]
MNDVADPYQEIGLPALSTRRGFVMNSLATGFALAVEPVSAETIRTDGQGLVAGEVKVPVACEAAHKTCAFTIYPEAPHGFNADYRPSYRAEPAKDGWARMLAWFKKYGAA